MTTARDRAHILEGLIKVLDNLDETIGIIRAAQDERSAQTALEERLERCSRGRLCGSLVLRTANDRDRLVEVVQDDGQPLEDVRPLPGVRQVVLRPPRDHVAGGA